MERLYNANTGQFIQEFGKDFWNPVDEAPGRNDWYWPHLQRLADGTYVMWNQENHRDRIKVAVWR